MSSLAKILLYLAAVVLLAALLSPPIYWALQAAGVLADQPFHRVFSRTLQLGAAALLVPLFLKARPWDLRGLGLRRDPHAWQNLAAGFLLAILPVVLLAVLYLCFDAYRVRKDLPLAPLFRIMGTAAAVAVAEEFIFRGVLLALAVKVLGWIRGLLGVSLLFALVHFLKAGKGEVGHVTWLGGFRQLGTFVDGLPPPHLFFWGFSSLLVAGLILGFAVLRTRALWLPIGLHAGWIMAQQGLQWFAKYRPKAPETLLPWVGPNLVSGAVPTGLAPLLVLLATGLLVWVYLKFSSPPSHD